MRVPGISNSVGLADTEDVTFARMSINVHLRAWFAHESMCTSSTRRAMLLVKVAVTVTILMTLAHFLFFPPAVELGIAENVSASIRVRGVPSLLPLPCTSPVCL